MSNLEVKIRYKCQYFKNRSTKSVMPSFITPPSKQANFESTRRGEMWLKNSAGLAVANSKRFSQM
jgi:hypothetical protein